MDKILIEIICPSLSRKWNFYASVDVMVCDTMSVIIKEITEYEEMKGIFKHFDRVDLYNSKGKILNPDFTLKENGVRSGDSLVII